MSSVIQTFQKRSQTLPVSHPDQAPGDSLLRRRLSSLSFNIQPKTSCATAWAMRRTKSVSAAGESAGNSVKLWWVWAMAWVLSRKPTFVEDLEMNEEETAVLGSQSKGSIRHMFFKVRKQIGKMLGSENDGLPQTFKYNSCNYEKTFDARKTMSFRG